MQSWRASGLVFGASAAVLMLEVIAGRLMAPYVGVSLETFTGIIGTVLAGIAVGAGVGGTLADRHDPRGLIGPALILGGALTWASLPILRVLGPGVGSGAGAIVFLTAAAFLAPATVLSAVSPMVTKLRLSDLDETGSVVGGLSAAGTIGAIVGTFATGFVLVAALPSRPVVLLIGGVLVAVGIAVSWRLGRRGPTVAMAAGLVVAGAGALLLAPPCERETAYFCANVERDEDRPSGRSLILDRTRHAHVDLEDPTYLDIRYVRLFAAVTAAASIETDTPLDVLHLGGGGFTFPGYVAAVRPGSQQLVLEIDPDLVEIATDELGLELDDDLRVRVGDARLALEEQDTDAYDLVLGDAFASTSVPWHLTTVEVMEQIDRMLRPDGMYVMNVIDGGPNRYARSQLATLDAQFDHVAVVVPTGGLPERGSVNQVLIASDSPIPDLEIDPLDGTVLRGDDVRRFIGDARVLTDDFAPVDQLLAR